MKKSFFIFIFISLTLGCIATMKHPEISLVDRKIIQNYSVPANKGRVVFYLGVVDNFLKPKVNRIADIYINEIKVGTIGNKEEMVVVDVPPNNYRFKWNFPQGAEGYDRALPEILKLHVQAGQTTYLAANIRTKAPPGAFLLGGLGAALFMKFYPFFNQDTSANGQQAMVDHKIVLFEKNFLEPSSMAPEQPQFIQQPKQAGSEIEPIEKVNKTQQIEAKPDLYKKLEKLKKMYDNNLITKEEYDKKRQELLNEF